MITFDNVSKSFGQQAVLAEAGFQLAPGDRVGLIGPNGAGKTTLFRLVLGEIFPDKGQIHRLRNLSLGHLPQEVGDIGRAPLLDLVMDTAADLRSIEAELETFSQALAEARDAAEQEALSRRQSLLLERFDLLDGYTLKSRAEKILAGLGFKPEEFNLPVDSFSGGWRMRALLARILLADPDLILLDEPTNHLDLASMLWLESYLDSLQSAVIVISHDRAFLDRTVKKIFELDRARLTVYSGNYAAFAAEKERRQVYVQAAFRQQQERIKQIQRFVDRNRSRKDRAAQVQGRLKMLEKMEIVEPPQDNREMSFSFPNCGRPPAVLVRLENVGLTYPDGRRVYHDLNLQLLRGERIALIGQNGAGKTTLLKILAGELWPTAGRRELSSGVRIAYYSQHQTEQLTPHLTVIEELMTVSGQASQTELRTILGAFLFSGDEVLKKVSVLSGGERARLILAKLLYSGANLLLLDEPTNHLDIPSRVALENALRAWPGAVGLVTHDRTLINAVANRIWEVNPGGRVEAFPGNLTDYLNTWQKLKTAAPEPAKGDTAPAEPSKSRRDKDRRRQEAEWRRVVGQETKILKERLEDLEDRVCRQEAELDELTARLASPEIYQNPAEAIALSQRLAQCKTELAALNDQWAEAALELEEKKARLEEERNGD